MVSGFNNTVKCEWLPNGRDIRILERIEFIDSNGRLWIVLPHSIVNGASIPKVFWSIIGSPFVGKYRRPSVFHDVYCQSHLRACDDVHKMFLEAMLLDGVSGAKAELMYDAVNKYTRW